MKHLKRYTVFESKSPSKGEVVAKIKWYSAWLERYLRDYNKFTTSNLNFNFSYSTQLTVREIFEVVSGLNEGSSDGVIRAIANEFITWSNHFILGDWGDKNLNRDIIESGNFHHLLPESDTGFLENYTELGNEMKRDSRELYNAALREKLYVYIGLKIKLLISGTEWDIPETRELTEGDREFLLDAIEYDLDSNPNWVEAIRKSGLEGLKAVGMWRNINRHPLIQLPENLDWNSEFIWRIGSYFGGVLVVNRCRIYLPFIIDKN